MTGILPVISSGVSGGVGTFGIASGTNGLHAGASFASATSGVVVLNGNTAFMSNGGLVATSPKDLVFLFGRSISNTSAISIPAQWNILYNTAGHIVAYKVSPGGESQVSISLPIASVFNSVTYTVRGWANAAPEIATAGGTSNQADPPPIFPSWGTSSPALFIYFMSTTSDIAAFPSAPDNNFLGGKFLNTANDGYVLAASKLPGTTGFGDATPWQLSVSRSWIAHSIAVKGK